MKENPARFRRETGRIFCRARERKRLIRPLVPASKTYTLISRYSGSVHVPAGRCPPVTVPAFVPLTVAGQHRLLTCFPFP